MSGFCLRSFSHRYHSLGFVRGITSGLKTLSGGEIGSITQLIVDGRHAAINRLEQEAKEGKRKLQLAKPPRNPGEKPWWARDYTNAQKIRDRELFA